MDHPSEHDHPSDPEHLSDPDHPGDHLHADGQGRDWGRFHDEVERAITWLADGQHVDFTDAVAPEDSQWRMRVSAGWPGVDGPGTLAHHLQVGSDPGHGALASFALTPFAANFGFGASRVGSDLAALGLEFAPDRPVNPGLLFGGPVGALEVADLAVELLRDVFRVARPSLVRVSGDPDWHFPAEPGPDSLTHIIDRAAGWWQHFGFTDEPWHNRVADHLVGWVDDVLVEVEQDHRSLPGLTVTVVRARVTDPTADATTVPPGRGMALARGVHTADGTELVVEPVRAADSLAHAWVHCTVVATEPRADDTFFDDDWSAVAAAEPAAVLPTPGADNGTDLAAVVRNVVRFVTDVRRTDPDAVRPARLVFRPAI